MATALTHRWPRLADTPDLRTAYCVAWFVRCLRCGCWATVLVQQNLRTRALRASIRIEEGDDCVELFV